MSERQPAKYSAPVVFIDADIADDA